MICLSMCPLTLLIFNDCCRSIDVDQFSARRVGRYAQLPARRGFLVDLYTCTRVSTRPQLQLTKHRNVSDTSTCASSSTCSCATKYVRPCLFVHSARQR